MRKLHRVHGQERGMVHISEIDHFQAWCDYLTKIFRFQCDLCGVRFFYALDLVDHQGDGCRILNRNRSKHA